MSAKFDLYKLEVKHLSVRKARQPAKIQNVCKFNLQKSKTSANFDPFKLQVKHLGGRIIRMKYNRREKKVQATHDYI